MVVRRKDECENKKVSQVIGVMGALALLFFGVLLLLTPVIAWTEVFSYIITGELTSSFVETMVNLMPMFVIIGWLLSVFILLKYGFEIIVKIKKEMKKDEARNR